MDIIVTKVAASDDDNAVVSTVNVSTTRVAGDETPYLRIKQDLDTILVPKGMVPAFLNSIKDTMGLTEFTR